MHRLIFNMLLMILLPPFLNLIYKLCVLFTCCFLLFFLFFNCIGQKLYVCMLPLLGQGYSDALVGILHCMVVWAFP